MTASTPPCPMIGERQGDDHREQHDAAVENIDRYDRDHPCENGESDDQCGSDDHAGFRRNRALRKNRDKAAATFELVPGDNHVRDDDRDRAEDLGDLAVAFLQQIGQRVLCDAAHARRDRVDDQDADPGAGGEPEFGDPGPECQSRGTEQTAGADPRTDQCCDQHVDRHAAAGNHEVFVGLDATAFVDADAQQHQYVKGYHGDVDHWRFSYSLLSARATRAKAITIDIESADVPVQFHRFFCACRRCIVLESRGRSVPDQHAGRCRPQAVAAARCRGRYPHFDRLH